jgi:hypothetical protein
MRLFLSRCIRKRNHDIPSLHLRRAHSSSRRPLLHERLHAYTMFVPRQIRKNKQNREDQDSIDVDLDPKGKENAPDPSGKENGEPKEQEKENG